MTSKPAEAVMTAEVGEGRDLNTVLVVDPLPDCVDPDPSEEVTAAHASTITNTSAEAIVVSSNSPETDHDTDICTDVASINGEQAPTFPKAKASQDESAIVGDLQAKVAELGSKLGSLVGMPSIPSWVAAIASYACATPF